MNSSYEALTEETRELALLDPARPPVRRRTPEPGVVLAALGALVLGALAALL